MVGFICTGDSVNASLIKSLLLGGCGPQSVCTALYEAGLICKQWSYGDSSYDFLNICSDIFIYIVVSELEDIYVQLDH